MTRRQHYRTDMCDPQSLARDGQPFEIVGFDAMDVGGDHPEPMFAVRFPDGATRYPVNPECVFTGWDSAFDSWCEKTAPGEGGAA